MILPEGRLVEPLRDPVPKDPLLVGSRHECELQRVRIGLPDDALDRVHEIAESPLRCDRRGVGGGEICGAVADFVFEFLTHLLQRSLGAAAAGADGDEDGRNEREHHQARNVGHLGRQRVERRA